MESPKREERKRHRIIIWRNTGWKSSKLQCDYRSIDPRISANSKGRHRRKWQWDISKSNCSKLVWKKLLKADSDKIHVLYKEKKDDSIFLTGNNVKVTCLMYRKKSVVNLEFYT